MKQTVKNSDKNKLSLAIKWVCVVVAAAYFVLLIAGKWIFGDDSVFYNGINIFGEATDPDPWLRSLSYIIFLCTLSWVVRLVLKLIAVRVTRGKALMDLLCSFIKYIAAIVLIFAVLSVWGVNTTALLAGIGILSLIVGLGAQPLIEDIIAGVFIVFEHVFEVGDIIVVDGFRGTVKEIGIRTTQIEDAGGDIKVVNNSDIRTLVNMTSQLSLAISEVDVEYGESLERVEVVIRDNLAAIADNIPDIVEGPYYMGVSKLGSSGVTLRFTAKCPEMQKFQVERDLNRQIKLLFDKYDINIPFTQVVVHDASALRRPAPAPETPVVGVSAAEDATAEAFRSDEAQDFVDEQRALSRGLDDESRN